MLCLSYTCSTFAYFEYIDSEPCSINLRAYVYCFISMQRYSARGKNNFGLNWRIWHFSLMHVKYMIWFWKCVHGILCLLAAQPNSAHRKNTIIQRFTIVLVCIYIRFKYQIYPCLNQFKQIDHSLSKIYMYIYNLLYIINVIQWNRYWFKKRVEW